MPSPFSWWDTLPDMVKRAVYVVGGLLLLLLVIRYMWPRNTVSGTSKLAALVRQAARWGAAAKQDRSPLMGLTHANYAAAYLQVLRELHGDAALADAATSFRISDLQADIDELQIKLQRSAAGQCPALQPASTLEASTLL